MASTAAQLDTQGQLFAASISRSKSRIELWADFIQSAGVQRIAEIGVYRGDFAAELLTRCPNITDYYMVDPWRHLSDWNKPFNHDDSVLEECLRETEVKTEFAAPKRHILRGKTTEVIDRIPDGELDLVYIDGDHSLKGITIDMVRAYAKVRPGGFLGGDDFFRWIWPFGPKEPTLVFPFAVHFAEAVGAKIYALPHAQFCLQKCADGQFGFVDLTGTYNDLSLLGQFALGNLAAQFRVRMLRKCQRIFRR